MVEADTRLHSVWLLSEQKARQEVERARVDMRTRIELRQAAKRRAELHWLCVKASARWIMLHRRAKRRIRRVEGAATLLQALIRMTPDQAAYVAHRRRQEEVKAMRRRHGAARVLQAGWRATHARLWLHRCARAATRVQAHWRGHVLRHHRPLDLRLGALAVARACDQLVESRPFARGGERLRKSFKRGAQR
eukprot:SAG31_NODE_4893_length_2881_cov_1.559310_4_plen_192_part_00